MGQYYYLDGQDPVGPFSLQDVYTLIDRAVVGPETMVCREGGADWQLLMTIPELAGKSRANRSRRSSSSSSSESRQKTKEGINVTAVIIASLFSAVAIYVTYTIGHQNDDTTQEATPDAEHVAGH